MTYQDMIDSLHPLERKVLPVLSKVTSFEDIVSKSGLKDIEVMRALQWLANKDILKIDEKEEQVVQRGDEIPEDKGGLPEVRFLESLDQQNPTKIDKIKEKANLSPEEFGAAMGLLKKNSCIIIGKDGIKKTPAENFFLEKSKKTITFLQSLPKDLNDFSEEEKQLLEELKNRKGLIEIKKTKLKSIKLTDLGKKAAEIKIDSNTQDRLTPKLLKTGEWKTKKFRRYDVSINVPKIYGGKRHFVNQAVDYIKKVWLEMGFKEMQGPMVQTSFWDLDALFVPQDHPARQMQDTFYIKDPKQGTLPKSIREDIKKVHEDGGNTGSKGWGDRYQEDIAKENLLRTHTTVLSAKTLTTLKKDNLPAKFFAVGKVFRNEALDWKHLFEFYQVEGIVVDPDANLKHLKGYLKAFYKKMGYTDVRMRPAHFPYTEPSVEVEVFHPVKKEWVELGGAGIFRPEVTKPLLGFECPVLAWGQGMGRIISEYWNITDIRDLYKNDLKQIREMKTWLK